MNVYFKNSLIKNNRCGNVISVTVVTYFGEFDMTVRNLRTAFVLIVILAKRYIRNDILAFVFLK